MADYLKRTLIVVAVGLLAGGLAMLPAAGQEPEAGADDEPELLAGGELIGVIPGTGMMRDEFRARAMVQLKAVALSALAYRLLHDDQYPPDLLTLKNSESWNLDLLNIFSGRPVRALYFEPQEGDFTTRPAFDLPMVVEQDGLTMGNLSTDGALDLDTLGQLHVMERPQDRVVLQRRGEYVIARCDEARDHQVEGVGCIGAKDDSHGVVEVEKGGDALPGAVYHPARLHRQPVTRAARAGTHVGHEILHGPGDALRFGP